MGCNVVVWMFLHLPEPSVFFCILTGCIFLYFALLLATHESEPSCVIVTGGPACRVGRGFTFLTSCYLSIFFLTVRAGVNGGRSGQALKEGEDSGAFVLTAVLIYSLTGTSLLGAASEGRSHLFRLLRLEIRPRLESDMRDPTNAHMRSGEGLTFTSTMNERDWNDSESWRKNEGWSRGLLGPRRGRSFIDCLSKRILQLLVALLNKSGSWKERSADLHSGGCLSR